MNEPREVCDQDPGFLTDNDGDFNFSYEDHYSTPYWQV